MRTLRTETDPLAADIAKHDARIESFNNTILLLREIADHVGYSESTINKANRAAATLQVVLRQQVIECRELKNMQPGKAVLNG
jgi:hypothetical protein